MPLSLDEQWDRLINKSRGNLDKETAGTHLRIKNSESFSASFNNIVAESSMDVRTISFFESSLEPLRSIAAVISNASRNEEGLQILYTALHVLLEGASHSPSMLKKTLNQVTELNKELSPFEEHADLFVNRPQLHGVLRDLFDDYVGFCTRSLHHLHRQRKHEGLDRKRLIFFRSTLLLAALAPCVLSWAWSYIYGLVGFGVCCASLIILYILLNLSNARLIEESFIVKDLTQTKASVQGTHNTLKRQISLLGKDLGPQEHSAITKILPVPMKDSSEADNPLDSTVANPTLRTIGDTRPVRNFSFTGRQSALDNIHKTLQSPFELSRKGPGCCVIQGIGGIGKTQTALQYTYIYEAFYDAIFWLKAETSVELAKSYAAIVDHVEGLSQDEELGKGVDASRKWLQKTHSQWLLVFDNVDDLKLVAQYIPRNSRSRGAMIVTTQLQYFKELTDIFCHLPLESLDLAAGLELLYKTLGKSRPLRDEKEEDTAVEILNIVGGLPLAITVMGGHISQSKSTLSEFLKHLKQSNGIWGITGKSFVENYEKTLRSVFDLAIAELPANAKSFLHILAFLNPDAIPEEMFLTYEGDDELLRSLSDQNNLHTMTVPLTLRQLIKREVSPDGAYFSIHRSLQLSILDGLSSSKTTRWTVFEQAFTLIQPQLPPASKIEISEPGVFHKYAKYVPQVISLRTHSLWPQPPLELTLEFAQVLANIGIYMWNVGLLQDGMTTLETAETILEKIGHDTDDPLMSDIDVPLGIIYDFIGVSRRKDALFRRQRALDIRTRTFEAIPKNDRTISDQIRLYNVEADMGCALLQQELFTEAQQKFDKCFAQYKSWEPVEDKLPFEYSKYYNHTAFVYTSQGKNVEAVDFSRRACRLLELHSGPKSPLVLLYQFVLANHLYHAGEFDKSLELNQEVLKARKNICGETNSYTQESYSFTGMLLGVCDRKEEAKEYLETALETIRRIHWSDEGVAYAHFRLAKVLQELGEHDEAVYHKNQARRISDKLLKAHPAYLEENPQSEVAIYDQMISIWSGRCSYRTKKGISTDSVKSKPKILDLAAEMCLTVDEI